MTSTDSSREIKAIKQRLAAAKSRVVADSNNVASAKQMSTKMIESAQSMSDAANKELEEAKAKAKRMKDELDSTKIMARTNIETIQSQLDVSQKEVQEVEKLLAEAEERAAKVDNVKQEKSSNKRRKVSIAGIGIKSEDDYDKETDDEEDLEGQRSASVAVKKEEDNAYDDETDKEDEDEGETTNQANNTVGINTTDNTRHTANTTAAARQSTSSNINEIVLEGCGKHDVNGTYTKVDGHMYDGVPVYSNGVYVIYRDLRSMGNKYSLNHNWFISVWHGDVNTIGENDWYGSPNNAGSMTPPTDGWVTINGSVGPAPSPLKKCGKCGISKKKHSYKAAEWNKREDNQRTCQVCIKAKAASLAHLCHLEELKEAEEYAKKVSPTPLLDEVDQVLVEGCGNVEINGIYIRSAHNGTAPTYTKRGVWKDKSVTFEIFWDKVNTWYIGLEYRVETWEREILFKHQVMIMGTEKTYPPKNGWKAVAGLYPAPKCRPMINDKPVGAANRSSLSDVDQIVVGGCESEVNGSYNQALGLVHRGNSVYTKLGQWDVSTSTGSPNFVIYREVLSSDKSVWYIGRLYSEVTSANVGSSFLLYKSQHNSATPPENDWEVWKP